MKVKITQVVERDTDRVLFRGDVQQLGVPGRSVTFHVRGEAAQRIADEVQAGTEVEVDL